MAQFTLFVDESGLFEGTDGSADRRNIGAVLAPGTYDQLLGTQHDLQRIVNGAAQEPWFRKISGQVQRWKADSEDVLQLFGDRPHWKGLHRGAIWEPELLGSERGSCPIRYVNLLNAGEEAEFRAGIHRLTSTVLQKMLRKVEGSLYVSVEDDQLATNDFAHNKALYRSMVLDLIATAATALPKETNLDGLQVVLSSIGNWLTGPEETQVFLSDLQLSFESGIAALGLLRAAQKRGPRPDPEGLVRVVSNSKHPLLRVADFVSNLTKNREHSPSRELFESLLGHGLTFFPAFGTSEERRARILERDSDWVGALILWTRLALPRATTQTAVTNKRIEPILEVNRITQNLRLSRTLFGARFALEQLIERLDQLRPGICSREFWNRLVLLEGAYSSDSLDGERDAQPELLFRLRSYMLVEANHQGLWKESKELLEKLGKASDDIFRNVTDFASYLRYQVSLCEHEVNGLNFEAALNVAEDHWNEVERFLGHHPKPDAPYGSPFEVRANWNLWRCTLLDLSIADGEKCSQLLTDSSPAWDRLIKLTPDDASRLYSTRSQAFSKSAHFGKVLEPGGGRDLADEYLAYLGDRKFSTYEASGIIRAETDWLLLGGSDAQSGVRYFGSSALSQQVDAITRRDISLFRHPEEVLLRDVAICQSLKGNQRAGIALLERCREYLHSRKATSPVYAWLYFLNDVTMAWVKDGRAEPRKKQIGSLHVPNEWLERLESMRVRAGEVVGGDLNDSPEHQLLRLRLASPY